MYAIKDYTTGFLYKCYKYDLRVCLESLFDCEQDGVQEAIDALCDDPYPLKHIGRKVFSILPSTL